MLLKYIRLKFSEVYKFGSYSMKLLSYENRVEAIKLAKQQFFKSQPTEIAFYKQFPSEIPNSHLFWDRVDLYSKALFDGGLSFGCYDLTNQQLIGVILAKNSSYIAPNDRYPQKGRFLYSVLQLKQKMISQTNLEYQYLFSRKSEVPIIDMWLSAVNPLHRRKGLQQKLISTVQHFGALKFYEFVVSWATNSATAVSHKKLGYIKVSQIDVKQFQHDGIKPFQEVQQAHRIQSFWIKALVKQKQKQKI